MNRTQALLIGFVILSWAALVAILVGAPDLYDTELRPLGLAGLPDVRLAFLAAITGLLVLLAIGTLRRWRWMFWLLLIAFAAGVLRVPLFALQVLGAVSSDVPLWYTGLQAVVGLVQVAIAAAMFAATDGMARGARSRLRPTAGPHAAGGNSRFRPHDESIVSGDSTHYKQ